MSMKEFKNTFINLCVLIYYFYSLKNLIIKIKKQYNKLMK